MDIERGSLEVLFKEISYDRVNIQSLDNMKRHDYKYIDQPLYMEHSQKVFKYYTEDERRNNYYFLLDQLKDNYVKKPNVFRFIMNTSRKLLTYEAGEIKCRFDEMLRWREISFQLGQDFFTCAYLACLDLESGNTTKYFDWLPIIRSDDERLHNILTRGMAENHFHLGGSTKIYEINWLCLMNIIDNRAHDFAKIEKALQGRDNYSINAKTSSSTFYEKCQLASLYRVYLFVILKGDSYLKEKLEVVINDCLYKGIRINERISVIQDTISLIKYKYGAKVNNKYVLDYALQKDMFDVNNGVCRLLAGERRFLYECYKASVTETFSDKQKNIFYVYLILRTYFRSELVQINRQVGFANFKNYQDRKEYFIEGRKAYEDEAIRLALNASLQKQNIVSLEARVCPSKKSNEIYKNLNRNHHIMNKLNEKAIYVFHFPKSSVEKFCVAAPRNYTVRNRTYLQTKAIASLLEKGTKINHSIRGIDACSNENSCRPEVFAQYFRYLTDLSYATKCNFNQIRGDRHTYANLHATYHAGEDFLDIVDGLRAIDEAILFCGLKRGSRIGHGLALGVNPYDYYKFKGYKLILSKQDLLDDIAWMLIKIKETSCQIDQQLFSDLESKFQSLYNEIYANQYKSSDNVSLLDYYRSWQLRGDYPKNYRLKTKDFLKKLSRTELQRISRYEFNYKVQNDIRNIEKYRKLYFLYHYNKEVRMFGSQMTDFKVDCRYADVVMQLQNKMIQKLVLEGIGIESNPSSNFLIGTIKKYEEHPIVRFNSRKLNVPSHNMSLSVSINTDDQGVFDTLLENEYALMTLALKKAKDNESNLNYDIEDIYEWIDYVRKMGIEQVFRNGKDEHI